VLVALIAMIIRRATPIRSISSAGDQSRLAWASRDRDEPGNKIRCRASGCTRAWFPSFTSSPWKNHECRIPLKSPDTAWSLARYQPWAVLPLRLIVGYGFVAMAAPNCCVDQNFSRHAPRLGFRCLT